VIDACEQSRIYAYFVLSLLTGVRTEEARALTWDRVHLEKTAKQGPHVEVWRSVRAHGDTKTKKSRRTLAIPDLVEQVLREHKVKQGLERDRAGSRREENGLASRRAPARSRTQATSAELCAWR